MDQKCSAPDCWNTAVRKGYCRRHSHLIPAPPAPRPPASEPVRIAAAQAEAQARQKSATAAVLLGVFVGYLGADRFYTGQPGLGIAKLLTCGGAGVWWVVDWFLIGGAVERANVAAAQETFARHGL